MSPLVTTLDTVIPAGRGAWVVLKSHSVTLGLISFGRTALTEQFKVKPLSAIVHVQVCEGHGDEDSVNTGSKTTEIRKMALPLLSILMYY